jgi:N-acetyl-gamma-glutamyl-phosphate reductase
MNDTAQDRTRPADHPATTRVAIVGASGYSGEELVRLLLGHPRVDLTAVTSRQYAGKSVAEVFPRFASHPLARDLRFCDPNTELLAKQADVVFLALPHGVAAEFAVPLMNAGCRVIDLSADFRLRSPAVYQEFYGHEHPAPALLEKAVYGLPEFHADAIRETLLVASPGCYPTSILLPLIPLLRDGVIQPDGIIADSLSGVSGAGRKAALALLFVECNESLRPYGVPKHRHLSEIEQELSVAAGRPLTIQFTPHLVPVNRGILTTLYVHPAAPVGTEDEQGAFLGMVEQSCSNAYANAPFVRVLGEGGLPDTKNVVGTNHLEFGWTLDPRTGRLLVMSAEDNLVKGASGQAVQSLNLMCGFPETAGLL